MLRALMVGCLGLCLLAGAVRAEDNSSDTDLLLARLERITHLRGEFRQRQLGPDGGLVAESSGSFSLLRPAYFSWRIQSPDSQLIVANEQYLWHYDIDLQTVTRRPVGGNVETSPLQILGGDHAQLRSQFSVSRDAEGVFTLTPLDSRHGFRRVTVTFAGDTVASMDIVDKLGERVVVDFVRVDAQSPVAPDEFEFSPPSGDVDLFYYDD